MIKELDQEVLNLFKDIEVTDEAGKASKVECFYHTCRTWADKSPNISLAKIEISHSKFTYNVSIVAELQEEINQILEQILLIFDNLGSAVISNIKKLNSNHWNFQLTVNNKLPLTTKKS